jgi:ABC-2 type transport system ATP-binding protein
MWDVIRELVADGTTVLLTTQYLDEADALADTISVIDRGEVIAEGTARDLKSRIGGEHLEVTLSTSATGSAGGSAVGAGGIDGAGGSGRSAAPGVVEAAVSALAPLATGPVQVLDDGRRLSAPVSARDGMATAVIRALDAAGVSVDDVEVHRPSLDDVFFALTGRPAEPAPSSPDPSDQTDPSDPELVEA